MVINRRWAQPISAALLLTLMALLWMIFAPIQFGGSSSYVIVAGASMEPTLSMGDLAVVKRSSSYEVGDIVTYQHPLAGPIIHRIIDRQGEQYTFRGDNNDWIDSYQPTSNEMIGKLWLHLPRQGQFLRTLRSPALMAGLAMLMAIGLFSTFRRQDPEAKQKKSKAKPPSRPPQFRDGMEGLIFALSAIAFTSAVLAIAAFSKPITAEISIPLEYEMRGQFAYEAEAPPGIYDRAQVTTGDPIYFNLTDRMMIAFDFRFSSEVMHGFEGSIRLDYELSDPGGWRRRFELSPMTSFNQESMVVSGVIDFNEIHAIINDFEDRTGFARPFYTLSIKPQVIAKASINGSEILETYQPSLDFRLEPLQMYLYSSEPEISDLEQLNPSRSGFVEHMVDAPNHLTILGIDVLVLSARWVAGVGGLIAIIGFLILGYLYLGASRDGEASRIGVRYGGMLIDIQKGNFVNGYHRIEVEDIDDLARFAERTGGVILHEMKTSRHHYFVQEGNITYHYATAPRRRRSRGTEGSAGSSVTKTKKTTEKSSAEAKANGKGSSNASTEVSKADTRWLERARLQIGKIDLAEAWKNLFQSLRTRASDFAQRLRRGSDDA